MIDSHVHLIWESFETDLNDVFIRASEAGVQAFIHSCVHTDDLPKMIELKKSYTNVFIAGGVHPCDGLKWTEKCQKDILKFKDEIIAIGESGLDYYHKDCPIDHQKSVFKKQCQLAKQLKLPLIVHCRDAFEDTLQILREEQPGGGVMHCYTGDAEYSAKFWELGFYTSFSGCLTFKSAHSLREEAKKIPIERTLIETDCPFLAPQKQRGKRNEPAFLKEVCHTLSLIHELDFQLVDEITTQNSIKLFRLPLI